MRYKHLLTPLGLNAHWSFRSDFWGIGTSVAGIGNMVSNLVTNHENVKMQEEINRRNIENQWAMFRAQNNRQDYLNSNQDFIKRQSLAKAGMNVNSEFGGYPNIATNNIPLAEQKAAQMSPPDFSLFAQMLQQAPLVKAQSRDLNAKAEAQEILNEREKAKDSQSNLYMNNIMSNSSLFGEGYNDVVTSDLDGGELSNVSIKGKGKKFNYGDFEFYRITKQFDNELKQFSYNDAKWSLDKMVLKAQGDDKKVLNSLINLPKGQLEQLAAATKLAVQQASTFDKQGQLFDAQAAFTNLQKKIQEESNLSQIFDDMMKDGLTLENVGRMLIACFVNFFKSSVSFSF